MRNLAHVVLSLVFFAITFIFLTTGSRERRDEGRYREEKESGTSGAMQALDCWSRSRAYPYKEIPADKYYRSFQNGRLKHKEIQSIQTAGSVWEPIGPSNLQGRALSVALNPLNPATVYVGTASGGLWRSYNEGSHGNWQQVKLGYPALGISAIVIDQTDTNVMYAGTGEVYRYQGANGGVSVRTMRGSYGIGILKTTDGGNTWAKSLDWSYNSERGIQAMQMNPLNHGSIWAATTEGLYATFDAGKTWRDVLDTVLAEDIVIDAADTTKMIVSFGDFSSQWAGLYRTLDGGKSWWICPVPGYSGKARLETYAAHPNVVFASVADSTTGVGSLWRTTNFGVSWSKLSDNTTNPIFQVQGWYSHFVAVHPTDSSQVVHSSVLTAKSRDGGRTFSGGGLGNYADNHNYAHHPTNPSILYVVNDDGVYRSTDFGTSFISAGSGMQTGQFYNGFSCSRTDSLLAIGQSQDHIPGYRYLGSEAWDHGSVTDEVGWTAIDPTNDNIMYAVDRNGGIISKSMDRGTSFSPVGYFDGSGGWNSPFILSAGNASILYVCDTRIHKSTDAGSTWFDLHAGIPLDGNPALSIAISSTSPDTVYIGMAPVVTRAHVFRTTNGGIDWQNITGNLPDRYPMDLSVDPRSSRIVYAALGGFGTGHLYKSTDAGTTWADITGSLPDVPTNAIIVDPLHSNSIYVGNDLGVYVSTDGGSSWSGFNEGFPDAVIAADLIISPSNRALRIATHGNGVWERRLLGELPTNYFDYTISSLDFPTSGMKSQTGTPISPLQVSIQNLGAQAQADSFNMRYQILRHDSVVFLTTIRIPGLGLAERRSVTFNESFTPHDTGYYKLQAISLAPDMNSQDDTLAGIIFVVSAPTIQKAVVNKLYSAYTEISEGLPGPSGDDVQLHVGLPFAIKYDSGTYDSVQISTNGWLEFGTGKEGSLGGLSTDAQLGAGFRPTQADDERPTKVLGPWWADLSTNETTGEIAYATLGVAPSRVFVVQWKNILAFYDATATETYLNFQVRLYETTNIIDYCYGPVVIGSFPANATGAAIVMKDYIGGDYRYYDFSKFSSGLVGELRADLNPIVDWPGQDSCYRINSNVATGIKEDRTAYAPRRFSLRQNYPNPFNPSTVISYELPVVSQVTLKVYNTLGQELATLVNAVQQAGYKSVEWNASAFPSGVYLYRLQTERYAEAKKLVLIK